MKRGAIYARISSDRGADTLGINRQVSDCEALAEQRGWTIAARYLDDDKSAWSGRKRPEYQRMLTDIRDGLIDGVLVYNLDRLHRQPAELERFFSICDQAGLKSLGSVSGDVDLATDDGRFHARILGAVARKESDDKSRRIRRKAIELAERGKLSGGGHRPFGYEPDRMRVRAAEAEVVSECARRFLAGESINSITKDLNERGIASSTGKAWSTQVFRRMLASARISGRREHRGEVVADAEWDAIITPAQSDRIRAVLADPSRRTNRTARRYLLSGLLRCGRCSAALVARPRDDGTRRYVCARKPGGSECGRLTVVADALEHHVAEAVLYRLDTPALIHMAEQVAADTDSDAATEVQVAETHSEELARAYAEKKITMAEWLTARKPIAEELERAQARLARDTQTDVIGAHIGAGAQLRASWSQLPLSRQKAIVAAVIDHLVVKPARRGPNRFDPNRVQPVWRA